MKRRVVVTGLGIVSSLGNTYQSVIESLRNGTSGIKQVPEWKDLGLKSTIAGVINGIKEKKENSSILKKDFLYMSDAALYCTLAAKDAIVDAGLDEKDLCDDMTGCIVGSGVGDTISIYQGGINLYNHRRINPYTILRSMSSSCSANVANIFHIGGRSYSISSACATSSHNIGHGFELIRGGTMEVCIAGGGEGVSSLIAAGFDVLRKALSTRYNDTPEKASRPYDVNRDGFVLSGGGGIVILESLEHAKARGAEIYCEVIGFWANSDGYDMALPEPEGYRIADCIRMSLKDAGIRPESVDYINTHATSTVFGDLAEIKAIQNIFGDLIPSISSTKSMGGHSIGAAGVQEMIHCIGMMEHNFVAPSKNIESLDPAFEGLPIVTQTTEKNLNIIISISLGFGGTNAVIVLEKYHE